MYIDYDVKMSSRNKFMYLGSFFYPNTLYGGREKKRHFCTGHPHVVGALKARIHAIDTASFDSIPIPIWRKMPICTSIIRKSM